jgi:hypothetical protein
MPRNLRQAHNRELFRAVNERIAEMADTFSVDGEVQTFICECSRVGCTEQIEVALPVYKQVRQTASAYLVLGGHEDRQREETIFGHGNYLIVLAQPDE